MADVASAADDVVSGVGMATHESVQAFRPSRLMMLNCYSLCCIVERISDFNPSTSVS